MRKIVIFTVLMIAATAHAEEAKQAAQASVDPNKIVTMTVAELNALLAAERASALASGAVAKLSAQVNESGPAPK